MPISEMVGATRRGSRHTDITGGMLQASEYLEETAAGEKYVPIFSDLEEDLQQGQIRDFPISLPDIHVVARNVTRPRSDNIDPRDYMERLDLREKRIYQAGLSPFHALFTSASAVFIVGAIMLFRGYRIPVQYH
ncbi:MAG: hypothetical protein OEN02_00230 [Gammaproteobacteria bacterium]|nr:hypothetical protein [Gammaproteobacteria bacterium]MDH3535169.1 hypothetical protein [Gammaproteobacteria bacterium]